MVINDVVLSLGSNLGNREENIDFAVQQLENYFNTEVSSSSIYETQPWGFETENLFLNSCVVFKTSESPETILKVLKEIEIEMGRVKKSQKNEYFSRVIDLDILYVGNQIINTSELVVPHPLLYERSFVLVPLLELLPNFIDPVKKQKISVLKSYLNDHKDVILYRQ